MAFFIKVTEDLIGIKTALFKTHEHICNGEECNCEIEISYKPKKKQFKNYPEIQRILGKLMDKDFCKDANIIVNDVSRREVKEERYDVQYKYRIEKNEEQTKKYFKKTTLSKNKIKNKNNCIFINKVSSEEEFDEEVIVQKIPASEDFIPAVCIFDKNVINEVTYQFRLRIKYDKVNKFAISIDIEMEIQCSPKNEFYADSDSAARNKKQFISFVDKLAKLFKNV